MVEEIEDVSPFVRSRNGEIVEVRSPYNGDVVGEVRYASAEDAELAMAAAVASARVVRGFASWQRAEILTKIADALVAETESLARLIALEAGKPVRDAKGEISRAVQTFRVAAEEAKRIDGEVRSADWTPGTEGRVAMSRRFPIGVVLGITPFNFPLNLVAHKVAPAIAAGCPIVIKPAPQTPLSALRLGRIAMEAGWPAEALAVLPCSNEVAAMMVADSRFAMLSFTGSALVGWKLKEAAPRKRVTLELGGNAAVIVCADADVELAAKKILPGGYTYAGQSCISVQRVYAHASVRDALVERLRAGVSALRLGDPMVDATTLGPMISTAAAERVEGWIDEAVAAGAKLEVGGARKNALLPGTLLTDVSSETMLGREEAFAPVVFVNAFERLEEALEAVNSSSYGLQAAIFTREWDAMSAAWRELEVGAVLVNESSAWRADHLPYGGVKNSGVGREGVRSAIEEMTEERLLIVPA